MKVLTEKGSGGRTVTRYLPESEEDVEELRRKAESRELDDRESLGDAN